MSDEVTQPKHKAGKTDSTPKGTLTARHIRDGKVIGEYVVSAELIKKEE